MARMLTTLLLRTCRTVRGRTAPRLQACLPQDMCTPQCEVASPRLGSKSGPGSGTARRTRIRAAKSDTRQSGFTLCCAFWGRLAVPKLGPQKGPCTLPNCTLFVSHTKHLCKNSCMWCRANEIIVSFDIPEAMVAQIQRISNVGGCMHTR